VRGAERLQGLDHQETGLFSKDSDFRHWANDGNLSRPRVSTAGLHRPNPVAREMPGFIGFFARRDQVAEREGFEPPIGLHLCRISSAVHSTTLPPLQAPRRVIHPRSGRVLGEDDGPDKAQAARFPRRRRSTKGASKWSI
jgi:hypothetical protein